MLKVRDLKIHFEKNNVIHKLNLDVFPGQMVFLLGKNGSGKTAFLKTIAGIFPDTNNSIQIENTNAAIYLNPQMELQAGLTGNDIFDLYGVCNSPWFSMEILESFEIKNKLSSPIETLSAGERQRILLSATLFYNSKLVLLDEPLSYLDISFHFVLRDILSNFVRLGRSFIISNHDLYFSNSFLDSKTLLILDPKTFIFESTHKVLNDKRLHSLFNIHVSFKNNDNTDYLVLEPKHKN